MSEDTTPGDDAVGEKDPLAILQERFTEVGAAERNKGMTAGKRALLAELGFANKEEALAAITAWRGSEGSATETQQQLSTLTTRNAELERKLTETSMSTAALQALVTEGVRPDRIDRSLQVILLDLKGLPEAPDATSVAAAVAAFKTETPEFFGQVKDPNQPDLSQSPAGVPGPSGLNGNPVPPGTTRGSDPAAAGIEEFERRFAKRPPLFGG